MSGITSTATPHPVKLKASPAMIMSEGRGSHAIEIEIHIVQAHGVGDVGRIDKNGLFGRERADVARLKIPG